MDYLLRSSAEGEIVWNSFGNDTAEGVTDEVMALARPDLLYKAHHFMMSFPASERAKWEKNLDAVIDDFGGRFSVHRMIWATHEDKDNFHVHGLVFAQTARGKKLRLETRDGDKVLPVAPSLRKMAQDWEYELGTRKTGRSHVLGISVAKDTLEQAQRQYIEGASNTPVPAKLQLRAEIQRLVSLSTSFADLQSRAAAAGIEIRFTEHDNSTGVSFSDGTCSLRGREAGCTFKTLTKAFNEPNPTIIRSRPDRSLAEGNRGIRSRPTTPRARKTDRTIGATTGGAGVWHRKQPDPYRGIEATIRHLSGHNHQAGLLSFLDFLTRALTVLSTSVDAGTAHGRRPPL
jgi:hypothetical protein